MLLAPEEVTPEVKFTVRRSLVSQAEEEEEKLAKSLQADVLDSDQEEEERQTGIRSTSIVL